MGSSSPRQTSTVPSVLARARAMMKAVALFCLFGFMGISGEPVGTCPSTNGEYVDFLIDDSDCTKFYKCDWGSPVLYVCPAELHFNPGLNVCDWPWAAGCAGGVPSPTVPSPTDSPTKPPPSGACGSVSCPAENGDFPVFHAHPKDCGRYCICDWGVGIDMACPEGLHFNTDLNVCDWPANAGCDGSGNPGIPTTSDSPPPTDQTTVPPPGPSTTENPPPTGSCGSVSCPAENGDFPVFHAHPENCGRYCVCDWGIGIDMACPEGLHFNTDLNVCDWPANAGCDGSGNPGIPTTSDAPPPTDQTTVPPPGPSTTENPPPTGSCGSVSCPAENGDFPVFHAHPENCGRYCVCDWGVGIDMACPEGLHFNTDLNICDWPANAGCDGSGSSVTPTTSDAPPPTDQTTVPPPGPSTTENPPPSGSCGSVSCPAENGDFPVFHAHPENCGRYCVCDWGVGIDMACPEGLHFNTDLNVCDWPANAGCDGSGSSVTPTTSDAPPSTDQTTVPPPGPSTTENPPPSGSCGSVSCPAENGDFPVFHAHPENCGRYCVCDWGVGIDMACPEGLHFNTDLNVCDWPANAGCDGSGSSVTPTTSDAPPPTDQTTVPPPGPSTTENPPPTGSCGSVSCPAENGDFPVFHAHPENCGRYCVCDWGVGIDMACPEGLHFNTDLNVCDWPANAGCDGSGSSVTPTTSDAPPPTDQTTVPPPGPSTTENPPPTGSCGSVSCPAENGDFPVFHAHPENCGRYCVCDWGVGIDMACPEGLHFNTDLNVCDWPANAGCDGSGSSVTPTTSDAPPPTDQTTVPPPGPSTTENPPPTGSCGSVSCPAENGDFPVFHAHPEDCGRYCICDWGVGIDMACPEGLHFNTDLNVCDWPADAGCDGSDTPVIPTTSDTPSPTKPTPTETTTSGNPPSTGGCDGVSCPAENGVYPVFHPHPSTCGRYCKCDWGVAYDMPCPEGLHFNPTLNVCDWPENAGC